MHLTILGRGRLGRTLDHLLRAAGVDVDLRSGRDGSTVSGPALICVPDSAIAAVAATIPRGSAVLHTSATATVEILRPHAPAGSLHPLMTFPGPEVAIPELAGVGAAVDGDPDALDLAHALAGRLGMVPFRVPGDRRLYHAAAVMAGNFATVLLADASATLAAAGVPRDAAPTLLAPLALESLKNARTGPERALTGPAARGDRATTDAHHDALIAAGLHEIADAYAVLTARAIDLAARRSKVDGRG